MEVNPIGRCYLGMCLSLDILDIEYGIEDKVICKFSDEEKIHKCKMYTNKKGWQYFILKNRRYYISDFITIKDEEL